MTLSHSRTLSSAWLATWRTMLSQCMRRNSENASALCLIKFSLSSGRTRISLAWNQSWAVLPPLGANVLCCVLPARSRVRMPNGWVEVAKLSALFHGDGRVGVRNHILRVPGAPTVTAHVRYYLKRDAGLAAHTWQDTERNRLGNNTQTVGRIKHYQVVIRLATHYPNINTYTWMVTGAARMHFAHRVFGLGSQTIDTVGAVRVHFAHRV